MGDLELDLLLDLGGHVCCELQSRYRIILFSPQVRRRV
jgi:hypothetical protein